MTKRKSDFTLPTNSLDELFSSQEERDDAKLERVKEIPLNELHPFKAHPFKIQNDDEMKRLMESIQKFGTLTPALARPMKDGGYELISGHRRLAACQMLGIETIPVIVREMSNDEAVIAMVDANLQREHILPSEKAFAYKMKRDALNHQGITSPQVGEKCVPDAPLHLVLICTQTPFRMAKYAPGADYYPPPQWQQHPGQGHKSRQEPR